MTRPQKRPRLRYPGIWSACVLTSIVGLSIGSTTASATDGVPTGSWSSTSSGTTGSLGSSGSSSWLPDPADGPLILADTNRDGFVDEQDAHGRDVSDEDSGALFLANLDDDLDACPAAKDDGGQLNDIELAACNDGADDIVNGDEDAADLARIQVLPTGSEEARIELGGVGASKVNTFVRVGDGDRAEGWQSLPVDGRLPSEMLSEGVELGIEGKDIVRDESWDGSVDVTVVHSQSGAEQARDTVQMSVAPLLFATDLMPLEKLYAADNKTSVYEGEEVDDLGDRAEHYDRVTAVQEPFREDLERGLEKMGDYPLELLPSMDGSRLDEAGTDIWMQDIVEPGFMSIPSPDGQQSMHTWVRAPGRSGQDDMDVNPFRNTSRIVFTELRGPDVAGVQHFDPEYRADPRISSYDTFGSTGNYGTVPAHRNDGENYPVGRKLFGSVNGYTADPAFNEMLSAQGTQDPIVVDTSWSGVGHVDEFLSFVPSNTERGWSMVVADPEMAVSLLKGLEDDGRGDEQLLQQAGLDIPQVDFPERTISETLADENIVKGTADSAAGVEEAVRVISQEVGLTEDDIVRVPVLFELGDGDQKSVRSGASIPDAANLIGTGRETVLIPRQHAPVVEGQDVFQSTIEAAFNDIGTDIEWVEDYGYSHPGGEIHCATNVLRDIDHGDPWWTE